MKRLALYVFWEKDGIVRDYVTYYLDALKKIADKVVVVVVNGTLSEEGKVTLEKHTVDFFVRENLGLDFSGWKAALEREGWDNVRSFDELILCNCSCYGPVYPFEDVFNVMNEKEGDFWGLYRHPAVEGRFPAHLQSYFLVIRKKLLCSKDFFMYWNNLTEARDWNAAVGQETFFTHYFEQRGFVSNSFIEYSKSGTLLINPTESLPHKLIIENNFPLVKRKAFIKNYDKFLEISNASHAKETIEFISKLFPIDYIYEDILHNMQGSDIRKILHHTFVLPENSVIAHDVNESKIAIIVFSYYEDLIDEDIAYMRSMPPESDAYIVVISEKLKNIWESKKHELTSKKVFVRKQINRGRNENAYWLTCRDVIENYDFICVAHDKKTLSAKLPIIGHYFSRHCWDNILKSPGYVSSIIKLFQNKPEMGILMPPTVVFDGYSYLFNREWTSNRNIGQKLYERLDLHIPFDESPDAPWGTMFWLRGKAMLPFYRYPWSIEDFPEEPLKTGDNTILHTLERMYPMIAQDAGYFSAWIMPESEAGIHFDNMYHVAKKNNASYKNALDKLRNTEEINLCNNKIHFKTIRRMIKAYIKKKWHKLFIKR